MVFRFISERGAEGFVAFVANEYELDVEVSSYLHVEILDEDFEDGESVEKIHQEANDFGGSLHED